MTLRRILTAVAAVAVLSAATTVSGQVRRSSSDAKPTVPMTIDLKIGTGEYKAAGQGSCTHAPQASLYDVKSQMWSVRHEAGPGRSLQLTLWKPTDGSSEMFNFASGTANVSVAPKGSPSGSGSVKFEPSEKGGVFRVDAKTADGKVIAGTIQCDAFTPHIAEGG